MKKLIIGTLTLLALPSAFAGNEIICKHSKVNGENIIEKRTYDLSKHQSVIQSFGTSRLNVMKQERGYMVAFEAIGPIGPAEYGPLKMIVIDDSEGAGNENIFLDLEYSSQGISEQKITCTTKYKVMFAR